MFHRQFRTVALVTLILSEIRKGIAAAGRDVSRTVHIGRPVRFVGDDDANDIAMARLTEACRHAGFAGFSFYPEPVAASLGYLHARTQAEAEAAPPARRGLLAAAQEAQRRGHRDAADLRLRRRHPGSVSAGVPRHAVSGVGHGGAAAGRQPYRSAHHQAAGVPELGEGSPIKSAQHLSRPDTVFPFYRYSTIC